MTDDEPDALFPAPATAAGRHHEQFEAAFTAARASQQLEDVDRALISLAMAGATALDRAESLSPAKGIYPVAQLLGPTREVLESLRMSPAIRASAVDDQMKELIRDLATPASPHPIDAD